MKTASRKQLVKVPSGKKLAPQLSQHSPALSPTTARGQPGAQSSGQQALQTQDWVS